MAATPRPTPHASKGASVLVEERDDRALPGQQTGYWFMSPTDIPATRPTYDPNGALLPRTTEPEGRALVLVGFDDVWFPLSEAAASVYSPMRAICEGGTAIFVVPGSARDDWPGQTYAVRAAPALTRARVAEAYGKKAALRARPDKKTVQVLLRRQ